MPIYYIQLFHSVCVFKGLGFYCKANIFNTPINWSYWAPRWYSHVKFLIAQIVCVESFPLLLTALQRASFHILYTRIDNKGYLDILNNLKIIWNSRTKSLLSISTVTKAIVQHLHMVLLFVSDHFPRHKVWGITSKLYWNTDEHMYMVCARTYGIQFLLDLNRPTCSHFETSRLSKTGH